MAEYLSAKAASKLAVQIQVYWASRGLQGVKVWAEPLQIDESEGKSFIFQVRSNIGELMRGRQLVS